MCEMKSEGRRFESCREHHFHEL